MASQTPSRVARRIQEVRVAKGLSRQDLADRLGVKYLQVYRVETGVVRRITDETVAEFAEALGVPSDSLYRKPRCP